VDVQILRGGAPQVKVAVDPVSAHGPKYDRCEFELVSLLFNGPGSIDTVFDTVAPDDFSSKELSRLYAAMVNQYRKLGAVDAGRMLDGVQDQDFASLLSEIVSTDWPADRVDIETRRMLKQMLQRIKVRRLAPLKEELIAATEAGDEERALRIQREIQGILDADKSQN
jgi:replicative DNA helicase